jgi:predicted DNA-binding protein with PD1-like motif
MQGRFEILSLSGSYTFVETGGIHHKNGMLSVSLAKPDGRVFGGGVAGALIAAGPIQVRPCISLI